MPHTPKFRTGALDAYETVLPDLAELCRIHDVGMELIERSNDVDELLDLVLEEYERRLRDLPPEALDTRLGPPSVDIAKKVRALVMFASQAAGLKSKASAASQMRLKAELLEEANEKLEAALSEAQRSKSRLDGVLEAVDTGILILDRSGRILLANRAARRLVGISPDEVPGGSGASCLGDVPPGGDGEVRLGREDGEASVLLVARRRLPMGDDSEVVLVSDITERQREIERRHHLEKLREVLRTLSVLSHKINNPLTSLMGRAQLLKTKSEADPSLAKAASVIEESAVRIADLIRELGKVVREGKQEAIDELLSMEGLAPVPGEEQR